MPKGIQGFKKGKKFTSENISISHKGIQSGKNNWIWKTEGVSYVGLYQWVRRWKGQAKYCENCGKEDKKGNGGKCNIQWANIDHQYKRILDDYIGLCQSCHTKYDVEHGLVSSKKGQKIKRYMAT